MEIENPAVLEVAVDNTDDFDVLAQPRDTRPQTADTAHIELYFHALLRHGVQCLDDVGIDERVELGHDVARFAPVCGVAGKPSLSINASSRARIPEAAPPQSA